MKLHNFNCLTSITLFYLEKNNIYFKGRVILLKKLAGKQITPLGFFLLTLAIADSLVKLLTAVFPCLPHCLISLPGHIPPSLFLLGNLQKPEAISFHRKMQKALPGVLWGPNPCCPMLQ